jgi:hypothetical protein
MSPAFDNLLMFRSTGVVTNSQSNGPLTIRGTGYIGMAARVTAPITGTQTVVTGFLLPRYWVSETNGAGTYHIAFTHPGGAAGCAYIPSVGLDLIIPIVTNYKYIVEELIVIATTPSFGVVQSGLVTAVGFDWDRAVHFE